MIAVFDVGNTNITIGVFQNNKIIDVFRIPTIFGKKENIFYKKLKKKLNKKKYEISDGFLGSVVPDVNKIIKKVLKKYFNIILKSLNKKVKLNIKNKYKKPEEVGEDRIANAVAAAKFFKNQNVIVVDFGTAITFDVINTREEYCGGLILPGINLCVQSLFEKTAKLPVVKIKNIKKFIGNTTETSIISGIKNGITGAIKYIINGIKKELKSNKVKIILTGGDANLIKFDIDKNQIIDKDFTLKGFKIIYDLNKER